MIYYTGSFEAGGRVLELKDFKVATLQHALSPKCIKIPCLRRLWGYVSICHDFVHIPIDRLSADRTLVNSLIRPLSPFVTCRF